MRSGVGRFIRLPPASILSSWLACALAALMAVAPLALKRGAQAVADSGQASVFDQSDFLTPSRPETTLRAEARSLKLVSPEAFDLAPTAAFAPERASRHTHISYLAEAAGAPAPAVAYGSRAPPQAPG